MGIGAQGTDCGMKRCVKWYVCNLTWQGCPSTIEGISIGIIIASFLFVINNNIKSSHILFSFWLCQRYRAYAAKEVILCAGTIHSPKLLMLSGVGPSRHLRDLQVLYFSTSLWKCFISHKYNHVSTFFIHLYIYNIIIYLPIENETSRNNKTCIIVTRFR